MGLGIVDLFIEFNSDLLVTASGDVVVAEGWDEIRQRIERRILTNPASQQSNGTYIPADYIFDQAYGLGARAAVGNLFNNATIQDFVQRIYQGVLTDSGTNTDIPPVVTYQITGPNEAEFTVVVTLNNGLQKTILLSLP